MRSSAVQALFATALLSAALLPAQAILSDDDIAKTPELLRRVEPPAQGMTAPELEKRADELRAAKAYADAVDYYKAAIKQKPSAQLYNKMGIAHLQLVRVDEARKNFQKALKFDKTLAEAHNNLGVAFYYGKDYGRAIKSYRKAVELNPESASFYSNLGTAYFGRKDFDKATAAYAKALELDPEIFDRQSRTGVALRYSSPQDRAHYSYVIAKMFAARGDAEHCLLYLKRALEDGFPVRQHFTRDAEFAVLRNDPRFTQLLQTAVVAIPD